ncbi:MAG: putative Na+/H+ antiporter [Spirochaetia bacterium]|nr:putative Na+/H+ antiporter [Spirochaetia bacterium]
MKQLRILAIFISLTAITINLNASEPTTDGISIPRPLESYQDKNMASVSEKLAHRIKTEPFNLVATLIFLLAIIHTFVSSKFRKIAHDLEHHHENKIKQKKDDKNAKKVKYVNEHEVEKEVSFGAEIMHFLGEIEVVFGLWVLALIGAIFFYYDWHAAMDYIAHKVNFTEPMFVVVIMALASTRPILKLSEQSLEFISKLGGGSAAAWWFSILTIGPILGSFITEPGAMTISAMLLANHFYKRKPTLKFAYATIGLLFVNISVGGTLTHFAAPPVLMVASKWNWDMTFMLTNYGWKAIIGIIVSNIIYFIIFRKEFAKLEPTPHWDVNTAVSIKWEERPDPIPAGVTIVHVLFLVWTVFTAHYPPFFIGGFLFFLGFAQATIHHQNRVDLKPPLLVGFFLAGLVIHGGLQAWWIAPILGSLAELPLMLGATILTAFNDNAAITYLSSLVPDFSDALKYAVVAGAVTGGGLTVIANAPNPAGQSILGKFFEYGVSPAKLALGALIPTIVLGFAFMLF